MLYLRYPVLVTFPLSLLATFASVLVVQGVVGAADRKTVASVRRLFGLFVISTIIWVIPVAIGTLISLLTYLKDASINEFVFGAFLVWGFELIVINGAFLVSTFESLILAAVHPVSVSLVVVLSLHGPSYDGYPAIWGALALVSILIFLLRLKGVRTRQGTSSIQVLHSFLKTWVGHEPGELERYFSVYAKNVLVKTQVLVATTVDDRTVVFVLPGVHPGPFSPVGSYNLSELIYQKIHDQRTLPVVLHGTGGHERNTPTNELASRYVDKVTEFIAAARRDLQKKGRVRGPLYSKVGVTNVTTLAFEKKVVAMISNSPYRSDDLDPTAITVALDVASELGLDLYLVDAHNSVDGEASAQPPLAREDWRQIFQEALMLPEEGFSLGFASSAEIGFRGGRDISDGGIGVSVFVVGDAKSALVTADSNNAVSGLRERMAEALKGMGVEFIELCTSDTHNFAARSLTDRGYFALGEDTSFDTIIDCVRRLLVLAGDRVAPCNFEATSFDTEIPLIGHESLDDFAVLTKDAISSTTGYMKVMLPAIFVLFVITLFY